MHLSIDNESYAGPPPPRLPDPSVTLDGPMSIASSELIQDGATDSEVMAKQLAVLRRQVPFQ